MSICPKCGKQNREGVKYCTSCGSPLLITTKPSQKKQASSPVNTSPTKSSQNTNSSVLIQLAIVAVVCAVIPLLLGSILGTPVRLIKSALPQLNCVGIIEGSPAMYLCSMKVGLVTMFPPLLIIVLIFLLRKILNKWMTSLNNKLPENSRFILPPLLATVLFTIAWAGYHASTLNTMGIVPNNIFPVFVGLFTYGVIRFGSTVQNRMASFFNGRDKIPIFLRYILVLAIPMGIALLITKQQIVTQEALKEQFVVLVGLVLAYLFVAPRVNEAPAGFGTSPSSPGFTGRATAMFLLAISGGVLARFLIEILSPEIALAGDCSEEWDCQQTAGYNAATATGGAAAGGAAAGGGAPAPGGAMPGEPTTRIIDGRAATVWLRNQGFLNADGTVTDRFRTWWNTLSGDRTRLDAIAGDFRIENGRIDGDVVIIVKDPPTVPHDRPPAPAGMGAEIVTENYSPGVDIRGTPDYIEHVRNYLNTMQGTEAGDELLSRVMIDGYSQGNKVTIIDTTGGNSCTYNGNGIIQPDGSRGPGCDSTLRFNPYRHSLPGANTNPDGTPDMTDWRNRPPDVGLEHELNHSYHAATGQIDNNVSPDPVSGGDVTNEDLRTVGIGPFGEDPTCENTYRSQRGLVPRPTYHTN